MSVFRGRARRDRVERLLVRYVGIRSVNPGIDGGDGEAQLAAAVAADLRDLGLQPVREPVHPAGRDNVVARLEGAPGAPVVMYHAHMDTVAPSGKATAEGRSTDGSVYGRGACDTKGSLVAMMEALDLLGGVDPKDRPSILFAAGVDEEFGGTGAQALVGAHPEVEMAVVGEPTGLEMATVHKGVLRFEIATRGVPAHSSKPHLGVNAIHRMGKVLDALERHYIRGLVERAHPLAGPPTLNVSTIRGGEALNVVPAECVVAVDRRLIPGETAAAVLGEIDALLEGLREEGVVVERGEPLLSTAALETPADHPLVGALGRAREAILGELGSPIGVPFGTDASFFAPAGIDCVVFGPGSIDQAHSDEEWVGIEETALAAEILAQTATELVGPGRG